MAPGGESSDFILTLWTSDAELARRADAAGVNRVGLDLETLGKRHRQPARLGTWITSHRLDQLDSLRAALTRATLFARTNPLHAGLGYEIEQLLDAGVGVLMFPNFEDAAEVESVLRLVRGRAHVVPLVERLSAARQIERIVSLSEIQEIHVGLNDLSFDLGLQNRLEVLVSPTLAGIASVASDAGKRLGIGGLARAGDANLPVPADFVYAQCARLNAGAALISRSFRAEVLLGTELANEIIALRARMNYWKICCPDEAERAFQALKAHLSLA
jgi:hypothetical protein